MTDNTPAEFGFSLPHGYTGPDGTLHREGTMRQSTAQDELSPLDDRRAREDSAYFGVVMLSLVITRLGTLREVNTEVIENLFPDDRAYLQKMYERINSPEAS